jgi:putative ABC transport system ATP-binding protein
VIDGPPRSEILVRLASISKTYVDGSAEVPAVRDVDLEIRRGEMVSLVGDSGSGKSTLLALLAGLRRPDRGSIWFDGTDITTLDDTERACLRGRQIGVVLQRGNLVPFLTASENVELVGRLSPDRSPPPPADELLDSLGVGYCARRLPRRLSGGEAQRVAVAMALANDPELLLADEATGELDDESAGQVMDLVTRLWQDRRLTVLYVTHDAALAARAQRRLRMIDGRVRS